MHQRTNRIELRLRKKGMKKPNPLRKIPLPLPSSRRLQPMPWGGALQWAGKSLKCISDINDFSKIHLDTLKSFALE